jgi:hypothetical protein
MSHRTVELICGHTKSVVVSRRLLAAVDQLKPQVRPCSGQIGVWAGSSLDITVFPYKHHYTNADRQRILVPVVERFK